jgi:hypothetical protein
MGKEARLIELRDRSGGLIFSLYITEKPLPEIPEEAKDNQPEKGPEKPKNQNAFMTDAQKRYLFRILADQGKEGEEAHEYLKKIFSVNSLKEVTKLEASQAIERLLAEQKGGVEK